jgi:hypothetical protein
LVAQADPKEMSENFQMLGVSIPNAFLEEVANRRLISPNKVCATKKNLWSTCTLEDRQKFVIFWLDWLTYSLKRKRSGRIIDRYLLDLSVRESFELHHRDDRPYDVIVSHPTERL